MGNCFAEGVGCQGCQGGGWDFFRQWGLVVGVWCGAFNKRQQFRKMPEVCKFIAGNVIYQIRCRHSPTRRSRQRSQRQRRQRSSWQQTLRRCLDQCWVCFQLWAALIRALKAIRTCSCRQNTQNHLWQAVTKTTTTPTAAAAAAATSTQTELTTFLHYTNNQCGACAREQDNKREQESASKSKCKSQREQRVRERAPAKRARCSITWERERVQQQRAGVGRAMQAAPK